jgi:signal transduction histidine kinase
MNEKPEKQLEILIIDDNKVDREAVRRALSSLSQGCKFVFHDADSGMAAQKTLAERGYDCVFLDYLLPDMDGVSLLKHLYNPDTDLINSPVVMLTGQGNEVVMLDALRFGAQDYISKENLSPAVLNIAMTKARELFEAKNARRKVEQQLNQAYKMEAVGQLTSGIAHDFNNLLTIIIGNVHLLRRRVDVKPEDFSLADIKKKIDAIELASNRGADLVRRLMVFTRQSPVMQEAVNINDCITETFELLKRALGVTIEIELILKDDLWPVLTDVSEFENILINFAVNARDAMPKGGKLTIETDNVMIDTSYVLQHPNVALGPYTMIVISDTGTGMTPEVKTRVFEPFFTTKPLGQGTGLGMSMAYGFIRQFSGHLHVYSEVGHGTVFRIYLPKFIPSDEAAVISEKAVLPTGNETILIVDDDDIVRFMASSILEKLGYKTLQADNARVALELLKIEHKKVDLILTDIIMPGGMSGIDLVTQIRKHYPNIKVLFTSGYSEHAIPEQQLPAGEELVSKPYRAEVLAQKIRKILDTQGGSDA